MFGECPRILCFKQKLLPYGPSEIPGKAKLKMYCANCNDIYEVDKPKHKDIDGAFFGPNFALMFVKSYPEMFEDCERLEYIGKVFGFKIHKSAISRPNKMAYYVETNEVKKVEKEVPVYSMAGEATKVRQFVINI